MPGATLSQAPNDDLDDILRYDVDDDTGNATSNNTNKAQESRTGDGIGIDKEVKIVKKRQPVPKLDENRILSSAGIPKLRKISKKLRFKGKGHEFSDMARLLNTYQLWLDDIYPRAKFADALTIMEKLGHSRRIQVMRKEWIDEGKPHVSVEDEDGPESHDPELIPSAAKTSGGAKNATGEDEEDEILMELENEADDRPERREPITTHDTEHDRPRDDELDGLLAEYRQTSADNQVMNEDPDDDDLDALLAEHDDMTRGLAHRKAEQQKSQQAFAGDDDFAEDMEAMAEMDMW